MTFSEYLLSWILGYQLRNHVWLNMSQMAKKLEVPTPTLFRWLSGNYLPRRNGLIKISEVLQVPMAQVLSATGRNPDTFFSSLDDLLTFLTKYPTPGGIDKDNAIAAIQRLCNLHTNDQWRSIAESWVREEVPTETKIKRIIQIAQLSNIAS